MKKTTSKNVTSKPRKTRSDKGTKVSETPPVETPAVEVKVSTVKSADDIESVFKPNKLGYFDAHASSIVWTGQDIAMYAFETVEEGQGVYASAMRRAILTISAAITCDDSCAKEIKEALAGKWADQTIAGIMSVAKMLPVFQAAGVDLNNVKDVMGLRDVSKTLKDANGDKRKLNGIVAKLNKGESPRKVKEHYSKSEGDEEENHTGAADSTPAKETRLAELYKMAKAVAKDCEGDAFTCAKIVANVAKSFGVSLTETTNETSED